MTARQLYVEATNRGLRLERRGEKLAVIPGKRCSPDFADVLRQHKGELLAMLEAKSENSAADCTPWLYVARQILAGEFEGADRSTRESLTIGLRSIRHPVCESALQALAVKRPRP